eukprot:3471565-Ditylum_brightwellii.AAC.1
MGGYYMFPGHAPLFSDSSFQFHGCACHLSVHLDTPVAQLGLTQGTQTHHQDSWRYNHDFDPHWHPTSSNCLDLQALDIWTKDIFCHHYVVSHNWAIGQQIIAHYIK